jgi:hypothetical protein
VAALVEEPQIPRRTNPRVARAGAEARGRRRRARGRGRRVGGPPPESQSGEQASRGRRERAPESWAARSSITGLMAAGSSAGRGRSKRARPWACSIPLESTSDAVTSRRPPSAWTTTERACSAVKRGPSGPPSGVAKTSCPRAERALRSRVSSCASSPGDRAPEASAIPWNATVVAPRAGSGRAKRRPARSQAERFTRWIFARIAGKSEWSAGTPPATSRRLLVNAPARRRRLAPSWPAAQRPWRDLSGPWVGPGAGPLCPEIPAARSRCCGAP